jgi:signal transduction histidine kinase
LKLDYPEYDPRRTDARVITEKLDQLEAIVTRVLNFAKAPSNLHSRWNVTEIINDTLVLIRLKLTQGKIQLQFDPPDRPLVVDVHKGQLQQVLLNLLLNASQAMPDGGTITVQLAQTHTSETGETLRIEVSDTGPGIPASMQDRIFDSFLSGRPDGSGLGLSIAKRILAGHHGDIILDRTGENGTTMTITLPLA